MNTAVIVSVTRPMVAEFANLPRVWRWPLSPNCKPSDPSKHLEYVRERLEEARQSAAITARRIEDGGYPR